jgi:Peptidase A4 family
MQFGAIAGAVLITAPGIASASAASNAAIAKSNASARYTATAASSAAIAKSNSSAGYTATDPSPITSFSGTLNVPTVTCPSSGNVNMNANINLTDPVSSYGAGFGWLIICSGGTATYSAAAAEVFMGAGEISAGEVAISNGDTLNLAMTNKAGVIKVSVTDTTSKVSASASAAVPASLTSILAKTLFSNGQSGNISPIPSFTNIQYGHLKFNAAILSSLSPTEYQMYDGTVLQVATNPIGAAGTFTTTFKHA